MNQALAGFLGYNSTASLPVTSRNVSTDEQKKRWLASIRLIALAPQFRVAPTYSGPSPS